MGGTFGFRPLFLRPAGHGDVDCLAFIDFQGRIAHRPGPPGAEAEPSEKQQKT
tara:strand:+ start:3276 stop:3434 length:159 start_codon:yes stop_codon:yes gene_type:complete